MLLKKQKTHIIFVVMAIGLLMPKDNYFLTAYYFSEPSSKAVKERLFYYEVSAQDSGYSNSEQSVNILPNLFYKQINNGKPSSVFISLRNKNAKFYISSTYLSTISFFLSFLSKNKILFPFHDFY